MKRALIAVVVLVSLCGTARAQAVSDPESPLVGVLSVSVVTGPGGTAAIDPCANIVRGIYTAGTQGNAPFSLSFTIIYFSAGTIIVVQDMVPLSETKLEGVLDRNTLIVSTSIPVSNPPDLNSPVIVSVDLDFEP